jgi:regulator of replication initiation timing
MNVTMLREDDVTKIVEAKNEAIRENIQLRMEIQKLRHECLKLHAQLRDKPPLPIQGVPDLATV